MLNISLALAFAVSTFFSLGGRLLSTVMDAADIGALPVYQGLLLNSFFNYLIPTVLIYVALRYSGIERKVTWSKAASVSLGIGNGLFVAFVAMRIFASTVEGGGGSYVVQSFARYIVWPAEALWAIGLAALVFHSLKRPKAVGTTAPPRFGTRGWLVVTAAVGLPSILLVSMLYLGKDAPLRISKETKAAFQEHCKSAGEVILQSPTGIQSLYLEPDSSARFGGVKDGRYHDVSGSILGEPLTNSGLLAFFEKKNPQLEKDPSAPKFTRFLMKERRFEAIDELTSEYGVFQRSLVSDEEKNRLKLGGTEVAIKNMRDGSVVATLTYFTSRKHAMVCGQSGNGEFGVDLFILRALKLTRQFHSAF